MLAVIYSSQFKKDAKRYQCDKKAQQIILDVITLLQTGMPLPTKYKEHKLIGNYIGYLEYHGKPDLLLIYKRNKTELTLYRVGSHSDLF